jgi:hypothetical protein
MRNFDHLPGGSVHQVDADGGESSRITQSLAGTSSASIIEGLRLASSDMYCHGGNVNLRHRVFSECASNVKTGRYLGAAQFS